MKGSGKQRLTTSSAVATNFGQCARPGSLPKVNPGQQVAAIGDNGHEFAVGLLGDVAFNRLDAIAALNSAMFLGD